MATVEQVANRALRLIIVQGAAAPLEAEEYQDFIGSMNSYMADLLAKGVDLGYTEVSQMSDEVTVPAGALRGLVANLAVEVAPEYGGIVTEMLVMAAKSGMQAIRRLGCPRPKSSFPSTLPTGSGNYNRFSTDFYPVEE